MGKYLRLTLEKYIEELSKKSIVPGGGSASAVCAALGAGLNLMVINYSIKRSSGDTRGKTLLAEKKKQEKFLKNLTSLVDEDCRVFSALMKTLSSGKSGDTQKRLMAAAETPFKICQFSDNSMAVAVTLSKTANKALMTDVGCAAHMLLAAFRSARLNVEINLKHIGDKAFGKNLKKTLVRLQKKIEQKAGRIERILKI